MKHKVLVVDNEASIREGLKEILTGANYEVTTIDNGREAIEKIHEDYYDVVITDLVLPDVSGMRVLKENKSLRPSSKTILITGYPSLNNAVEAMKNGASDYLVKPFKANDIVITVERFLEKSNGERDISDLEISLDRTEVLKNLSNAIRIAIIEALDKFERLRLVEIAEILDIKDPTKLIFHLRLLKKADIVKKDRFKVWSLTGEGKKVADLVMSLG